MAHRQHARCSAPDAARAPAPRSKHSNPAICTPSPLGLRPHLCSSCARNSRSCSSAAGATLHSRSAPCSRATSSRSPSSCRSAAARPASASWPRCRARRSSSASICRQGGWPGFRRFLKQSRGRPPSSRRQCSRECAQLFQGREGTAYLVVLLHRPVLGGQVAAGGPGERVPKLGLRRLVPRRRLGLPRSRAGVSLGPSGRCLGSRHAIAAAGPCKLHTSTAAPAPAWASGWAPSARRDCPGCRRRLACRPARPWRAPPPAGRARRERSGWWTGPAAAAPRLPARLPAASPRRRRSRRPPQRRGPASLHGRRWRAWL